VVADVDLEAGEDPQRLFVQLPGHRPILLDEVGEEAVSRIGAGREVVVRDADGFQADGVAAA